MKKKLFIILVFLVFIVSCTSTDQKKSAETTEKAKESITKEDKLTKMVLILDSLDEPKDKREEALVYLYENDYPKLKNIIENLLLNEDELEKELLEKSINYSNFKYNDLMRQKAVNLSIEKEAIEQFVQIYEKEILNEENIYNSFLNKITIHSQNYNTLLKVAKINSIRELFYDLLDYNFIKTIDYFQDEYFKWVEEVLLNNEKMFVKLEKVIDDNYDLYKDTVNYYKINGNEQGKSVAIELFVKNSKNTKDLLLSDDYNIQNYAIRYFGTEESYNYFNENLSIRNYLAYRGLAILNHPDIFEKTKKAFEITNDFKFIKIIYLIRDEKAYEYIENVLIKNSSEDIKKKLAELYEADREKILNIARNIFLKTEDKEIRIVISEFIIKNYPNYVVSFMADVYHNEEITEDEKKIIATFLHFTDNRTKEKALEIVEKNIFEKTITKLDEISSYTEKIDFLNNQLSKFSQDIYHREINKHMMIIKAKIEEILLEYEKSVDLTNISNVEEKKVMQLYIEKNIEKINEIDKKYQRFEQKQYILKRMDGNKDDEIKINKINIENIQEEIIKIREKILILIEIFLQKYPDATEEIFVIGEL